MPTPTDMTHRPTHYTYSPTTYIPTYHPTYYPTTYIPTFSPTYHGGKSGKWGGGSDPGSKSGKGAKSGSWGSDWWGSSHAPTTYSPTTFPPTTYIPTYYPVSYVETNNISYHDVFDTSGCRREIFRQQDKRRHFYSHNLLVNVSDHSHANHGAPDRPANTFYISTYRYPYLYAYIPPHLFNIYADIRTHLLLLWEGFKE